MKITTYWYTLMLYAYKEAQARQIGDPLLIRAAEAKHAEYKALCARPDVTMVLDY